jgi:serine protease Do
MKKYVFVTSLLFLCFSFMNYSVQAQQDNKPKKEGKHDQIIIKSKDGKDTKLTIEVKDGEVIVNGKPLAEFKDDHVTIRKGNDLLFDLQTEPFAMTIPRSQYRGHNFYFNDGDRLSKLNDKLSDLNDMDMNKPFLGVVSEKHNDGARITEVMEKTAAEKAGLKEGDIITRLNDKIIDDPNDLSKAISTYKPDDKVTINYKRNGKDEKTTLTLGKKKNIRAFGLSRSFDGNRDFNFDFPGFNGHPKLGIKAQETDEGKGVKVLEVDEDSPAAKAGLKEGDIITELNGQQINDVDVLRDSAMEAISKGSFGVKYTRDGKAAETTIKIPKKLKTADL